MRGCSTHHQLHVICGQSHTSEDSSSSLFAAFRFRGVLPLPAGRPRGLLPPSPAADRFRGAAVPLALALEGVLTGELPLSVTKVKRSNGANPIARGSLSCAGFAYAVLSGCARARVIMRSLMFVTPTCR